MTEAKGAKLSQWQNPKRSAILGIVLLPQGPWLLHYVAQGWLEGAVEIPDSIVASSKVGDWN